MYKKFSIVLISALTLASCAKDRTLEDYRDEKVAEEVAKIKAVAGGYNGTLYSHKTGGVLGPVFIDVEPDTTVGTSTDGLYQEQHVGLKSTVTFIGQQMGVLTFSGAYDSVNSSFKLVTTLTTRRATQQELSLGGAFANGQLSGEIEATGYPGDSGFFTLSRATSSTPSSPPGTEGSQGEDPPVQLFGGNTNDVHSTALKLILLTHQIGSDQAFLDNFLPVKTVDLTLDFGNGLVQVFFKNAVWDLQRGMIEGQSNGYSSTTAPGGAIAYEIDLTCRQRTITNPDKTQDLAWLCQYVSDKQGLLFTTLLSPIKGTPPPPKDNL